jgi:hypothetical protein
MVSASTGTISQQEERSAMADKVKDLNLDKFVEMVIEHDDELAKKVSASELDATAIIGKAKPGIDRYGIATGVAYAIARLKEAVLEANSESLKGLLVGQRDVFGTNAPIRMPVLSSKGDHTEVINWGSTVKYGDSKIEIPYPCVANLRVLHEGEYKGVPNIRIVSVESYENVSIPDTILRLNKVAKRVGDIDGGDELGVVVVRGKISYISPATRWKGKEKDGSWNLWMPNQRDNPVSHPVMQMSLETENNNSVRVIFGRQRIAVPTVAVEDFADLCADAAKKMGDPVEQARFFGEIFRGRNVIVVGFLTKYNPQPEVNYIDIGAYAIFDANVGKQETVDEPAEKPAKKQKPAPAEEDETEADAEEPKAETKKPAAKTKPAAKKDGAQSVEKLKEKIRQYCEVLGIDVADLTSEKVIENLAQGKSKGFVNEILDEMKKE